MRVALLSDIHGNPIALDAVLADIEARGSVDEYWLLGDYAAIGPDPVATLERLNDLPNATFVRGNTDRYLLTGEGPWPREVDLAADPSLKPRYDEVQSSFEWTRARLRQSGGLDWLKQLPLDRRVDLPDGSRALLVHASPGTDDGEGLHPAQTDDERRELVNGCAADTLLVGHTHWAGRLRSDDIDIIAAGSVSNPHPPDLRASYAVLETGANRYAVEHHRVTYDLRASITAAETFGNPSSAWIAGYFRGEHTPVWSA